MSFSTEQQQSSTMLSGFCLQGYFFFSFFRPKKSSANKQTRLRSYQRGTQNAEWQQTSEEEGYGFHVVVTSWSHFCECCGLVAYVTNTKDEKKEKSHAFSLFLSLSLLVGTMITLPSLTEIQNLTNLEEIEALLNQTLKREQDLQEELDEAVTSSLRMEDELHIIDTVPYAHFFFFLHQLFQFFVRG
jgi:hypothetical protein